MVKTGTIQGFRVYSFTPEGQSKPVEGFTVAVMPDGEFNQEGVVGCLPDIGSISFRDIGSYAPSVGDRVQYHVYRANGKVRYGYFLLL